VIREAQVTCVRLADDALGATEASQRKMGDLGRQVEASQQKLEDFSRRTEVSLDVLRADVAAIRAELAGSQHRPPPAATPQAPPAPAALPAAEDVNELAEALERRLATRLGQQVLQLSEALRRVVQAQALLHRQLAPQATAAHACAPTVPSLGHGSGCATAPMGGGVSDAQRRTAIDDLYRELRNLEEQGPGCCSSCPTARMPRPKGPARRGARAAA